MWFRKVRRKRLTKRLPRHGTLLSSRRHNRRCAITVEFLLMDSTISRTSSGFGKCHAPAAENSRVVTTCKDGNRVNYGSYDSNYTDRFTVTTAFNGRLTMCLILDMRRTGNLARTPASETSDESRVCVFKEFSPIFAAENAAPGRLNTCPPLSRKISEREW